MHVEGKGVVAPKPHRMSIDRDELMYLYREAQRRAKYRSYAGAGGTWKRGLTNGELIPGIGEVDRATLPILRGLVGEYAVSVAVNNLLGKKIFEVDCTLRKNGDGGLDLQACGLTVQVKTRRKTADELLMRRVTERKAMVGMTADACAFCAWEGAATALVLGWNWTSELRRLGKFDGARIGEHWNLVCQDEHLKPIADLASELEARL